jgi:hypothetical protein
MQVGEEGHEQQGRDDGRHQSGGRGH